MCKKVWLLFWLPVGPRRDLSCWDWSSEIEVVEIGVVRLKLLRLEQWDWSCWDRSSEIDWHVARVMCKYVDQLLAIKRSAGVSPEVNLRYPLHTANEKHKWVDPHWLRHQNRVISNQQKVHVFYQFIFKNTCQGSTLALKSRVDVIRSSKQACQWHHKD